jgi:hypothetical protein
MIPVVAQCPTCQGTGKIVCPQCNGVPVVKPSISNLGSQSWTNDGGLLVVGNFQNNEDIGVYGTLIAKVESMYQNYTQTSSRTYFPPHERIQVSITIDNIEYLDYSYLSSQWHILGTMKVSEVDDITCPYCDGTGFVTCPDCGGLVIDAGAREQKQDVTISSPIDLSIVGIGVVAAVAIAAVVAVRRKKLTEKDLRKLPSNEFQNWVIQKLLGKASSPRDSRIGIDAYTADGYPIQIMQSDNIDRNVIEKFASVMGRIKAKKGIMVAFSFSDDVYRGIARAKINYQIEIKCLTINELIKSRKIKSL